MIRMNRCSASFDIILLIPFLVPIVNGYAIKALKTVHELLFLEGEFHSFDQTNLMFVSLLSLISIVWGITRYKYPSLHFLKADTIARFCIAFVIGSYIIFLGVSKVFYIFVAIEIGMGIVQIISLNSESNDHLQSANYHI